MRNFCCHTQETYSDWALRGADGPHHAPPGHQKPGILLLALLQGQQQGTRFLVTWWAYWVPFASVSTKSLQAGRDARGWLELMDAHENNTYHQIEYFVHHLVGRMSVVFKPYERTCCSCPLRKANYITPTIVSASCCKLSKSALFVRTHSHEESHSHMDE